MANTVEAAKTGRARCRTCNQGIEKGELRFGEEVANAFSESGGTTFHWHHLRCAAKKKPSQVQEALTTFTGEVPNREEIEKIIADNLAKEKPSAFPYAERAASGRSHCGECHKTIEKGALRVAIAREQEDGPQIGMMPATPRYLHAEHARAVLPGDLDVIVGQIRKNSRGLKPEDLEELARILRESPAPAAPERSDADESGADESGAGEGSEGAPRALDRDHDPVPF